MLILHIRIDIYLFNFLVLILAFLALHFASSCPPQPAVLEFTPTQLANQQSRNRRRSVDGAVAVGLALNDATRAALKSGPAR
jgi:hypothetical protein